MKRDNEQVDLIRLPNGVITFPTTNHASISIVQQKSSPPKVNTSSTSQTTVLAHRKSTATVSVPDHVESTSQTTVYALRKSTFPVPVSANVEPLQTTVDTNAPGKSTTVNNVTTSIPRKTLTLPELRVHHAKYGHISIEATIAILRTQNNFRHTL